MSEKEDQQLPQQKSKKNKPKELLPVSTGQNQLLIPLDFQPFLFSSSSPNNNNKNDKNNDDDDAAAQKSDASPPRRNLCPLARSKQELDTISESLGGGITAFKGLPIDLMKQYIYVVTKASELTSENIEKLYSSRKQEFCICAMYAPQFVDAAVKLGLLPMTIPFGKGFPEFLAPKLHVNRCLVRLPSSSASNNNNIKSPKKQQEETTLKLPDGIGKKSKKFALIMDGGFWDICCLELVAQHEKAHGHSWLNPFLQKTYYAMNCDPTRFETNLHAISVVHASSVPAIAAARQKLREAKTDAEKLAARAEFDKVAKEAFCAGEIGCSVGTMYTSLTGGFVVSGTGSIQLGALAVLLVECGYEIWDLGMAMDYKTKNLGGIQVTRKKWLEIAAEHSKRQPTRKLGSLDGYVVQCSSIIDAYEKEFETPTVPVVEAVKKDAAVASSEGAKASA
jgi:hypothetical protein